jgi:hypothetical protein
MKRISISREQALGIIRHTLTFVGGLLVLRGLVDEAIVNEIVGGVITLTGTIWSVVSKQS